MYSKTLNMQCIVLHDVGYEHSNTYVFTSSSVEIWL